MIAASEMKNQLSRESMWFQFFFAVQLVFFPLEFSTPLKQMQYTYATNKCLHKWQFCACILSLRVFYQHEFQFLIRRMIRKYFYISTNATQTTHKGTKTKTREM